ncbi:MAG: class I SAM-dependent methyltransferase [Desulfobaccales bacterium]
MSGILQGSSPEPSEAGSYTHDHKGKSSEPVVNKEIILEALPLQAGQTILDAGCGNGYMAKIFAEKVTPGGKVYALDIDADAIEVLRNETQGSNIETMVGDLTKPIPLERSSVDLIYISTVLHGFPKNTVKNIFEEAKRILKPNGVLAVLEIEKKDTPFGPPLHIRYSPAELRELAPLTPLATIPVTEHLYLQTFKNFC